MREEMTFTPSRGGKCFNKEILVYLQEVKFKEFIIHKILNYRKRMIRNSLGTYM